MDSFVIYSGSDGQILSDQIKKEGRPYDLTSATVRFKMRNAENSTVVIDSAATIEDAETGQVSYAWSDADLADRGEFYGWWRVVNPDTTDLETQEFHIIITEHAPGLRTRTGAFYLHAKSQMPVSWRHLEAEVGDYILQTKVEIVKKQLFATDIAVEDEINEDIRVQSYVGKCVTLSVIPMAIDYWMNQHQTLSATGTNENVSYPDRIEALNKLYERLVAEIAKEQDEIAAIIGVTTVKPLTSVPGVSGGTDEGFATPLASDNFFPYSFPPLDNVNW